MLRLGTFGGVTVTRDGRPVVGFDASPKRLALLTLLAAAGDHGVGRDALVALLWPESDEAAARHSLDQALHAIRRLLGDDDAITGTRTLALNAERLAVDVWEFEAALRASQLERAAALHRGAFADGLLVKDAPDVERRLAAVRTRLADAHAAALDRLAHAAAARGDRAGAVTWWRRAADADPLRATAARELVSALVAAGEPAQALRAALVHEALVRQEELPLDAEIASWIQRLRADDAAIASRATPASGSVRADDAGTDARRRAERVARAVGRRYRVGELVEDGSIVATWTASLADAVAQDVEIQVVQSSLAAVADASHFVRTMQAAASVADPRVLSILDAAVVDDVLFAITARRDRPSLRDRVRRDGALPLAEALAIGRDVAHALASAHERGVHHGDLRPKHVSLGANGAVVAGFGLVEALTGHHGEGSSTVVSLGVPAYQSPEQVGRAARADARADVYALGCLLYEMLAGEPPFGRRPSAASMRRKLAEGPPALREVRENVPEAVEQVVMQCLARVPGDRYASGGEVVKALGSAAQ